MFFNQPLSSSTGSASSERAVLSCHCLLLRQGLQEIPLGQKFSDSIKYCTRISQSYVDFSVPLCPFALRFKKKHTRKRIFLYSSGILSYEPCRPLAYSGNIEACFTSAVNAFKYVSVHFGTCSVRPNINGNDLKGVCCISFAHFLLTSNKYTEDINHLLCDTMLMYTNSAPIVSNLNI